MAVRDPLRHPATQARHNSDEGSHEAATDGEPKMHERIFDPGPDAFAKILRRQLARNRGPSDREVNDLGNGEYAHQDRDQVEPVP